MSSSSSSPKTRDNNDNNNNDKLMTITKNEEVYHHGTTVIVSNYHQKYLDGNNNNIKVHNQQNDLNNNEDRFNNKNVLSTNEQLVSSTTTHIGNDNNNNKSYIDNNNNDSSPTMQHSKLIEDFKTTTYQRCIGLVKQEALSPKSEDINGREIRHHLHHGEPPLLHYSSLNNNRGVPVINSTEKFVRNPFMSYNNHRMQQNSPCYTNPFISNQTFSGLQQQPSSPYNNHGNFFSFIRNIMIYLTHLFLKFLLLLKVFYCIWLWCLVS